MSLLNNADRMRVGSRVSIAIRSATALWPPLLVCIALLIPIVQLVMGVQMWGHDQARDGPFAVSTLVQFRSELLAGQFLPRWAVSGYAGLGSPIFFFYPPGAYFAASLLGFAFPTLSVANIIGLTQVLFRAAALFTCFVWLRRRTSREAALTGSALYALMPWVSIFNPQIRLAFAECAATALMPLLFLAVDASLVANAGRSGALKVIVFVAAAMCILTLVHLPTTVVAGGLVIIYAASSASTWHEAPRAAAAAAVGVMFGLGLAAFYLLPAVGLLAAISTAELWDQSHPPEAYFILGRATFQSLHGLFLDVSLLVPVLLAAIFSCDAIVQRRVSWAIIATLAIAIYLTLPFSAPVWARLTPLRMIQFPARFLVPISLLAAALIALESSRAALQRLALATGFGLGAAAIVFSIWFGDGMSDGAARTRQALAHPYPIAPEYIPAEAGARGWLGPEFDKRGGDVQMRAARLASVCVHGYSPPERGSNSGLTFGVAGCVGPTVLPHFYFPGWVAKAGGQILPVISDPASGLVSIVVPPTTESVTLNRTLLPVELLGLLVSGISLSLWLGGLVALSRGRHGGSSSNLRICAKFDSFSLERNLTKPREKAGHS